MIEPEPFAAYHRAGRRMTLARAIPTAIVALAVVTGLGFVASAAPPAQPAATMARETSAAVLPQPAASPAASPVAAPVTAPVLPQPTLAATGEQKWSIAIGTTGYQAEIDKCVWVRMDLGTHAPIVGAHNYCGGDIVLSMAIGDSVTLSGVGLDGVYTVLAARDARAGDNAQVATHGLGGTVILQTCYWGGDGAERLVALAPQ